MMLISSLVYGGFGVLVFSGLGVTAVSKSCCGVSRGVSMVNRYKGGFRGD